MLLKYDVSVHEMDLTRTSTSKMQSWEQGFLTPRAPAVTDALTHADTSSSSSRSLLCLFYVLELLRVKVFMVEKILKPLLSGIPACLKIRYPYVWLLQSKLPSYQFPPKCSVLQSEHASWIWSNMFSKEKNERMPSRRSFCMGSPPSRKHFHYKCSS